MSAADSPDRGAGPARVALLLGLVLTGASMRTAVTSVGAALDAIEHSLGTGSSGSGVITTLPVLCFAGLGALAPRIAARLGTHRLLVGALAVMAVGTALRAFTGSLVLFVLCSVLALAGGAVSNVLMPGLVKLHFPDRIASMTAVYTTALAVGQTAAIGLTVPIGHLASSTDDQWRVGLGSWALLAVVAIVPWLGMLRGDRPVSRVVASGAAALRRNRTAWAMALFFGFQSLQAYVAFGWFPTFFTDHGASDGRASALVAFYSALSIPVAMVMPALTARAPRALVLTLGSLMIIAYAGLLSAPSGGVAWVWMLFAGIGAGQFQLFLTLTGLIAGTPLQAARLSAFAQGFGYLVAGTGPLLTGVLLGATGSWTGPFVLLFVAQAACLVSGSYLTGSALPRRRPVRVDAVPVADAGVASV